MVMPSLADALFGRCPMPHYPVPHLTEKGYIILAQQTWDDVIIVVIYFFSLNKF